MMYSLPKGGDWMPTKGKVGCDKGTGRYYISWYDEFTKKSYKIWHDLQGEKLYHEKQAESLHGAMFADWKRLKGAFNINKYIKRKSDVGVFLNRWLEAKKPNLSENTYYSWRGFIKNHIEPYFDNRNIALHEIDFTILLEFVNQLPHKGQSKITVLSPLKSALAHAKQRDRIIEVMPDFPGRRDIKIQKKSIKWLPVDRVFNVIHSMLDCHQPIFVWCYLHMRRPSEAMALWKSDYTDDMFHIQRDFVMSKLVDYTKTDRDYVTPCAKAFKPYTAQMAKSFSPFYFVNPYGKTKTKHYTQSTMTSILKRALRKANEVDINLYNILKHSAITQAHRDGVSDADLAMAADIDIQTVGKYRDAAVVEKKRAVFDRVVRRIGNARNKI